MGWKNSTPKVAASRFRGILWYGDITHWGRGKISAFSQTTFLNAFYWMKMYESRLRFHRSSFQRFELTVFQHWFRQRLGADQATSHYLNQCWSNYWCIYASLGLNESNIRQYWIKPRWTSIAGSFIISQCFHENKRNDFSISIYITLKFVQLT